MRYFEILVFLLKESFTLTEINFNNHNNQLEEFRKLDFENQGAIEKLVQETKLHEVAYFKNLNHFKQSRELFREKLQALLEALEPSTFDRAIMTHKVQIDRSITTHGMKTRHQKVIRRIPRVAWCLCRASGGSQSFHFGNASTVRYRIWLKGVKADGVRNQRFSKSIRRTDSDR